MPQKYFLFHVKDWVTEYETRWDRVQCTVKSIDKLKDRLNVIQRAVAQQQKDIEQNKRSIGNCTLPRLKKDIRQLQAILDTHQEKENSKARAELIEKTKVQIERKKMLIEDISKSPGEILPEVQAFISKQKEQLEKLQQRANDLNKELVSKMAQLEKDKAYVQFFQSTFSEHIANALDKTFKIPTLEKRQPFVHNR